MSSTDNINNNIITCAACGKEGDGDHNMNMCNKCKAVKYCNAACKKRHRKTHKKKCEIWAAELHEVEIFKDPPPPDDCQICFQPLPFDPNQTIFRTCCGKLICLGCTGGMLEDAFMKRKKEEELAICPFCRAPHAKTNKEEIKRYKNLMENDNADAYFYLAGAYADGLRGLTPDRQKANELYLKAGELGCAGAYFNLGNAYDNGRGVEVDEEKAKYYWELSAMGGDVGARYNLGYTELQAGNIQRAVKHFMISARAGDVDSLDSVKSAFRDGIITKDEYEDTLRSYHKYQVEIKSDMRDKAAAIVNNRL